MCSEKLCWVLLFIYSKVLELVRTRAIDERESKGDGAKAVLWTSRAIVRLSIKFLSE